MSSSLRGRSCTDLVNTGCLLAVLDMPSPDEQSDCRPEGVAYGSPGWYPSKAEHDKVVPTWNYELVHLHGTIEIYDESGWLLEHVNVLTNQNEEKVASGSGERWKVVDAPDPFIHKKLMGIVGIELRVERIEAKRKLSQNRSDSDRAEVREEMERSRSTGSKELGVSMAST